MEKITLLRYESSNQGTFGWLILPGFNILYSMELPNYNNSRNISRIPSGEYLSKAHTSPRFGNCYWLQDVPNRSEILIHPGNLAGDTLSGFKTHSFGCILPGVRRGMFGKQKGVYSSRPALKRIKDAMNGRDFILKIMEVPGV